MWGVNIKRNKIVFLLILIFCYISINCVFSADSNDIILEKQISEISSTTTDNNLESVYLNSNEANKLKSNTEDYKLKSTNNEKIKSTSSKTKTKKTNTTNSIKTTNIIKSSKNLKNYVNENGDLPNKITINKKNYTIPQFLYLEAKSITTINTNKNISNVKINAKNISNPTNSNKNQINTKLNKTEYIQVTKNTIDYLEKNNKAPNSVYTTKGDISYKQLVYSLAKCLDYYKNNKNLPNYLIIEDINVYKKINLNNCFKPFFQSQQTI